MRLAELERAVQDHVLAGGELPAALAAAVAPPAAERWRIYTDAYRLRLTEALAAQYPALAARLGTDAFALRADAFITATPSEFRSIRDYGAEFGAFIRTTAADLEDQMLAELAEFEWQIAGAFDAADVVATLPEELAGIAPAAWPELRFRAVPSLRRLRTVTNAIDAFRAQQAASDGAAAVPPPAARAAATDWLIHRRMLTPQFRPLAPDERAALDSLLAGASFGELCAGLGATLGEAAAVKAAGWLKGWLLEGLLLRV
jgi:putative DNA-binding protein